MIDLDPVRNRICELTTLNHVGDAVDAADAIENMVAPVPCAYVSVAREGASPNKNSTGRHSQLVTTDVSVLFALGAQRADAKLRDEVEAMRRDIIEKLIGWTASGANLPFDYVGYSVRFMGNGLFWGELLFRTKWLISKDAG